MFFMNLKPELQKLRIPCVVKRLETHQQEQRTVLTDTEKCAAIQPDFPYQERRQISLVARYQRRSPLRLPRSCQMQVVIQNFVVKVHSPQLRKHRKN